MDCVFCKIVSGEFSSNTLYEDDDVLAFKDLDPQAPVHFLVIPKRHIESCDKLSEDNAKLLSKIFSVIRKLGEEQGLENGYRVITNVGEDGGQSVKHLHFHVLGKRKLLWPPG